MSLPRSLKMSLKRIDNNNYMPIDSIPHTICALKFIAQPFTPPTIAMGSFSAAAAELILICSYLTEYYSTFFYVFLYFPAMTLR